MMLTKSIPLFSDRNNEQLKNLSRAISFTVEKHDGEKVPFQEFGCIACRQKQNIQKVPLEDPGIFFVFEGSKNLSDTSESLTLEAGNLLMVSGDSTVNIENLPDPQTQKYSALFINLTENLIQKLLMLCDENTRPISGGSMEKYRIEPIHYETGDAVRQFLEFFANEQLKPSEKRMQLKILEIIMSVFDRHPEFFHKIRFKKTWTSKVKAIVLENLEHKWDLEQVSRKLFVSESTLYRHLKEEGTGFREIMENRRMAKALSLVQTGRQSITEIAPECGYESMSRFTERFTKRFGISPSKLRKTMTVSG